jgi:hypothetical protein
MCFERALGYAKFNLQPPRFVLDFVAASLVTGGSSEEKPIQLSIEDFRTLSEVVVASRKWPEEKDWEVRSADRIVFGFRIPGHCLGRHPGLGCAQFIPCDSWQPNYDGFILFGRIWWLSHACIFPLAECAYAPSVFLTP